MTVKIRWRGMKVATRSKVCWLEHGPAADHRTVLLGEIGPGHPAHQLLDPPPVSSRENDAPMVAGTLVL
jgi:hypothetical protein